MSENGNGSKGNMQFDEAMCERYLFGELSEADQERFENAYFNDNSSFDRFLAVKHELLDLYNRNELDADKRRRMGPHFQSTAPRRKAIVESRDFVRSVTLVADRSAVSKIVAPDGEPGRVGVLGAIKRFLTLPKLVTAAALLILAALGLWNLGRDVTPERAAEPIGQRAEPTGPSPETASTPVPVEPNDNSNKPVRDEAVPPPQTEQQGQHDPARELKSASNTATPSTEGQPAPSPSPNSAPPQQPEQAAPPETKVPAVPVRPVEPKIEFAGVRTESVVLDSASRSVSKRNTATLGSSTQNVSIRLIFGGEAYASYSVRVTTLGGATVWRGGGLNAGTGEGRKSLAVTVPAGSLSRKDYIVTLEGRSKDGASEIIREYYMHVERP